MRKKFFFAMIYIYELATLNRIKSKNTTLKKKGIKALKIVIKDLSDVVERKKNTQASLKKEEKGYKHLRCRRKERNCRNAQKFSWQRRIANPTELKGVAFGEKLFKNLVQ